MKSSDESGPVFPLLPLVTLAELMTVWPQVIPLLLERHMACVGLQHGAFRNADATILYGLNLQALLADHIRVIDNQKKRSGCCPARKNYTGTNIRRFIRF
jgi:hypothetical protein